MFKINKLLKTKIFNDIVIKSIELEFILGNNVLILNADKLIHVNWNDLSTSGCITIPFNKKSNDDLGLIEIFIKDNLLYFDIDTSIGIKYYHTVPYAETMNEINELIEWYNKYIN